LIGITDRLRTHGEIGYNNISYLSYNSIFLFLCFQPVDLLPFRIEDARRQLELEGDYSFEALTLLRKAEEERRGKDQPDFDRQDPGSML
jgi:hypothetical protein